MKQKKVELEVDVIGGGRPLTKEDEIAISAFIRARKKAPLLKNSTIKRSLKRKTKRTAKV